MMYRKKFFAWIAFFFSAVFPLIALASNVSNSSGFSVNLTPPETDVSVGFLSNIFGLVDGVLHGGSSQLIGNMFGVFNSAVLALGAILAGYVTMVSTLNTAHQGEVLGQKWSSIWIPLRLVTGIGLILPKASGYCLIQIFVMWVVVQGVGAADSIWHAALTYLTRGGVIVQPPINPNSLGNVQQVLTSSGNVMTGLVCIQGLERLLNQQRQDALNNKQPDPGPVPSTIASVNGFAAAQCNSTSCTIPFPNFNGPLFGNYQSFTGACGTLSWSNTIAASSNSVAAQDVAGTRAAATQQMVIDLINPSTTVVNHYFSNSPSARLPLGFNASQQQAPIWTGSAAGPPLMTGSELENAVQDYNSIMLPVLRAASQNTAAASAVALQDRLEKNGWIMAGEYFFDIVQMNNQITSLASDSPPSFTPAAAYKTSIPNAGNPALNGLGGSYQEQLNDLMSNNAFANQSLQSYIANAKGFAAYAFNNISNQGNTSPLSPQAQAGLISGVAIGGVLAGAISPALTAGIVMMIWPIVELSKLVNAQSTGVNPLIQVAMLGFAVLNAVTVIWLIGAAYTAAITAVVSIGACLNPLPYAVLAFLMWFLPLFTFLIGILFVSGIGMGYVVPLIPYVIFTFSALGWFVSVIESMIAAPMVGLSVAAPEGHEAFGKATSGFMLLLGVFLRPSLMLFGFFAATILSYVAIWLFNQGYFYIWGNVYLTGPLAGPQALAFFFGLVALVCMYMMIVVAIINKCFSLIHVVPDKVLRWFGGQQESLGGEFAGHAMQDVQGKVTGGAQQVGGEMNRGLGKGGQMIESRGERALQEDAGKKKSMKVGSEEEGSQSSSSSDTLHTAKESPKGEDSSSVGIGPKPTESSSDKGPSSNQGSGNNPSSSGNSSGGGNPPSS